MYQHYTVCMFDLIIIEICKLSPVSFIPPFTSAIVVGTVIALICRFNYLKHMRKGTHKPNYQDYNVNCCKHHRCRDNE